MSAPLETDLGRLAEDYVSLALHLHNHDPNPYIFIGDKAFEAEVKEDKRALPELERALAAELEEIIPGSGPLPERMSAFRDRFLVPPEHVEKVVATTLEESRKRTRANMDLPEDEGITLLMNNFGEFGAFAEYLGKGRTNVHFSTTMPFHVDRAVELSTHEAHPGHHIQATLLEAEMLDKRGWREWEILPLFGAHTIVAEGAANYGVSLSFTRAERIAYDRDEAARRT